MKVTVIGYEGNDHMVIGELQLLDGKIVTAVNPHHPNQVRASKLLATIATIPVRYSGRETGPDTPEAFLHVLQVQYSGAYLRVTAPTGDVRKEFVESEHPREPAGSEGGGQFTSGGGGGGGAAPEGGGGGRKAPEGFEGKSPEDQARQIKPEDEAKAGREAVEKLMPEVPGGALMTDAPPVQPKLGDQFEKALTYTFQAHREQTRKGTDIPYIGHLLGVASLVIEDGGDEEHVIAALLHDAMEDQGGQARLEDIRAHFGSRVAAIVEACSDSDVIGEKPPWRPRKEKYLEHLKSAPFEALRVSAADKLYNARAILADYRSLGEGLWSRFNAPRDEILWFYESLASTFRRRGPESLAREMEAVVRTLLHLVRRHETQYQAAVADLQGVMSPVGRELDDQSAEFLARLRAAGGLRDADWQHILREIPAALRFLAGPNPTVTRNEHGQLVLNPDADPRNADWIRLAAAARKAQHHLPLWAAMWLWQVGHTRGARFWDGVARIAEQMHLPRHEPDPA